MSGLALARRVGNRYWEWSFASQTYPFLLLGEWDEVLDMTGALSDEAVAHVRIAMTSFLGHTSRSSTSTGASSTRPGRLTTASRRQGKETMSRNAPSMRSALP